MASQAEINAVNEALRLATENTALAARIAELEDHLERSKPVLAMHNGLAAERDRYRKALESILEMTNEDHHARTDAARVYEIRTYARYALKP